MLHLEGNRTPEMRRGRERLTARHPRIEQALASLALDDFDIADTRRFGNDLQAHADAWLRRKGPSEQGRISKQDANRLLALAMSGRRV